MTEDLRGKILNAKDVKSKIIIVPEWDMARVKVMGLTGRARAELLESCMTGQGKVDLVRFYPEIIIATACDPETGKPIFTQGDRDLLNEKSGAALERVAMTAAGLSGLDPKAMETAEKNSPPAQSKGSTSS